jgi:predicted N-formylglutamate amidohydrolase
MSLWSEGRRAAHDQSACGARSLAHVTIEMRNDLITEERGQDEWAERLSDALTEAGAH